MTQTDNVLKNSSVPFSLMHNRNDLFVLLHNKPVIFGRQERKASRFEKDSLRRRKYFLRHDPLLTI
jgi:hypothetical protein